MAQQIGSAKVVKGQMTALGPEGSRNLEPGNPVFKGDTIATTKGSAGSIEFLDKTVLNVGEASRVSLDQYVYNADKGTGQALFKMAQGTFRTVTGEIVKQNPESFKMQSPLATIGIRGTETGSTIPPPGQGSESHLVLIFDGKPVIIQPIGGGQFQVLSTSGVKIEVNQFGVGPVLIMTPQEFKYFQALTPAVIQQQGAPTDTISTTSGQQTGNVDPKVQAANDAAAKAQADAAAKAAAAAAAKAAAEAAAEVAARTTDPAAKAAAEAAAKAAAEAAAKAEAEAKAAAEAASKAQAEAFAAMQAQALADAARAAAELAAQQGQQQDQQPPFSLTPGSIFTLSSLTNTGSTSTGTLNTGGDSIQVIVSGGVTEPPPVEPINPPVIVTTPPPTPTVSQTLLDLSSESAPQFVDLGANESTASGSPARSQAYYEDMENHQNWNQSGPTYEEGVHQLASSILHVVGTTGADTIFGNDQANVISGNGGNDIIDGKGGDDTISVGAGDVHIYGGAGNDIISMGATLTSADVVNGGADTDTLIFTGSNDGLDTADQLTHVTGIEKIIFSDAETALTMTTALADTLNATAEDRHVEIYGPATHSLHFDASDVSSDSEAVFTIHGGSADDDITGGAGDDTISGGAGNDILDGGGGNDTITYAAETGGQGVQFHVANGSVIDTYGGTDTVSGFEFAILSKNDDHVYIDGSSLGDLRSVDFGGGTDTLHITIPEADLTTNEQGQPVTFTNLENIVLGSANPTDIFAMFSAAQANGQFWRIDASETSQSHHMITIQGDMDTQNSIDLSHLTFGPGWINGGQHNTLRIFAGDQGDTIIGPSVSSIIEGGAGADHITGGAGDDTFHMGSNLTSDDTISGGGGYDTVHFSPAQGASSPLGGVSEVEKLMVSDPGGAVSITSPSSLAYSAQGHVLSVDISSFTHDITWDASPDTSGGGYDFRLPLSAKAVITGSGAADGFIFDSPGLVHAETSLNGGAGQDKLIINADVDLRPAWVDLAHTGIANIEEIHILSGSTAKFYADQLDSVTTLAGTSGQAETLESYAPTTGWTFDLSSPSLNLSHWEAQDHIKLFGSSENDTFQLGSHMSSSVYISGGGGADDLVFTQHSQSGNEIHDLDHVTGVGHISFGNATTNITSVDSLVANGGTLMMDVLNSTHDFTFNGSAETNGSFSVLYSGTGASTIYGGYGNDIITSYASTSTIYAGYGNDLVSMGAALTGSQIISGGSGMDALAFIGGTDPDILSRVTGFEFIILNNTNTSASLKLTNSSFVDMEDSGGKATINVAADMIDGSHSLTFDASDLSSYLYVNQVHVTGGQGNDTIKGGHNDDTIYGGAGDDTIIGGGGADTLTGGQGNDLFIYTAPSEGGDTITDFTAGQDKIGILANTAFGFVNTSALAGHVYSTNAAYDAATSETGPCFYFDNDNHKLMYDADGHDTGSAAREIATLNGVPGISASDIVVVDASHHMV